jgi:hypothetical protein
MNYECAFKFAIILWSRQTNCGHNHMLQNISKVDNFYDTGGSF